MRFRFKALKDNKVVVGKMEANDEKDLIMYLKSKNYFPFEVSSAEKDQNEWVDDILNRVTFNDVVNFTRQFSITLNAGLTLLDSLSIFKKQVQKKPFLRMIKDIDTQLRSGKSFSDALKHYPAHFSNLYVALVKAGEASGKLNEILANLAIDLEQKRAFNGKIKGALLYPTIIFIGMNVIVFILLTFVIPQITVLYEDLGIELPVITKVMIQISNFLTLTWPIVLSAVGGGVYLLYRLFKAPQTRTFFDLLIMRIPGVSDIYKVTSLVNSTQTLSILVSSGVSLLEGLDIIIETTGNTIYQRAFAKVKRKVEQGTTLGHAMEEEEVFPPILTQMTMVGEQTGTLDRTMQNITDYFRVESELALKTMTTLIEPTILVVMGVIVGFIITAVITPIYSLTNNF